MAPGSQDRTMTRRPLRILMASDFFYPRLGGVETHIFQLSQALIARGHAVVVVTHAYDDRVGVRYMTSGLKVYYVPFVRMVMETTFPTFTIATLPLVRNIILREEIDVVHGHQSTSVLMHDSLLIARTMGLPAVYTDHSLFGFADAASIHLNKVLKFTLSDISQCITVSNTCKENLVLRARLNPHSVSVVPNAVDVTKFTPDPSKRWPRGTVNIVVVSRLMYRKGVNLLVNIIPEVCDRFPNVHFIVGGDGDKRLLLEEMLEKHHLHDRVEMLGAVPHVQVANVLRRGHIFLNCSLTEAFCIAILEAACCGLYVVSTKVGGVPEVLPSHMIRFATPNSSALVEALSDVIPHVPRTVVPAEVHAEVRCMYRWPDVARRTEKVYRRALAQEPLTLMERFRRYYGCGVFAGKLFVILIAFIYLYYCLIEMLFPRDEIERAVHVPNAATRNSGSGSSAGSGSAGSGSARSGCSGASADSGSAVTKTAAAVAKGMAGELSLKVE